MKRQSTTEGISDFRHGRTTHTDGAKRWTVSGLLALTLVLAGCGGGGSSSGGGTAAGVGVAGTYGGQGTITLSGGGVSVTQPGSVTITISPTGSVMVDTGDPSTGSGSLAGDSFTANQPLAPIGTSIGLSCTGDVLWNGTVSGNTITGTISSSGASCNGLAMDISGSFSATKVGKAPRQRESLLMDSLYRATRVGR